MPPRALIVSLLAFLVLLAAGCGDDDSAAEDRLPDVDLTTLDGGEPVEWGEEGKPLVVNLWASWCVPCRTEMPAFDQVHRAVGDQVTILGVTDDDRGAALEAAEASGVTYPLAHDGDHRVLVELGIAQLPATVFVDGEGRIVGQHLGQMTEAELLAEIEERYDIRP